MHASADLERRRRDDEDFRAVMPALYGGLFVGYLVAALWMSGLVLVIALPVLLCQTLGLVHVPNAVARRPWLVVPVVLGTHGAALGGVTWLWSITEYGRAWPQVLWGGAMLCAPAIVCQIAWVLVAVAGLRRRRSAAQPRVAGQP